MPTALSAPTRPRRAEEPGFAARWETARDSIEAMREADARARRRAHPDPPQCAVYVHVRARRPPRPRATRPRARRASASSGGCAARAGVGRGWRTSSSSPGHCAGPTADAAAWACFLSQSRTSRPLSDGALLLRLGPARLVDWGFLRPSPSARPLLARVAFRAWSRQLAAAGGGAATGGEREPGREPVGERGDERAERFSSPKEIVRPAAAERTVSAALGRGGRRAGRLGSRDLVRELVPETRR